MITQSEFRMAYYDHDGNRHTVYPDSKAQDSEQALSDLLEHYMESGYGTGGHIESYAGASIGWVLNDWKESDPEHVSFAKPMDVGQGQQAPVLLAYEAQLRKDTPD